MFCLSFSLFLTFNNLKDPLLDNDFICICIYISFLLVDGQKDSVMIISDSVPSSLNSTKVAVIL